jgi:hypothetical protein
MGVQARFRCAEVHDFGSFRTVVLAPVYSSDKSSPNFSWSQATPSGKLEMTITNPAAYSQFVVGMEYALILEGVAKAQV